MNFDLGSIRRIKNLVRIECKNCSKEFIKSLIDASYPNSSLEVMKILDIPYEKWDSFAAPSLHKLICSTTSLRTLELGPVSPTFLECMAFPLSINRSLRELVLIGHSDHIYDGAMVAANILVASQTIQRLALRSFTFFVFGGTWNNLIQGLRQNKSLTHFDLDCVFEEKLTPFFLRRLAQGNGLLKELRVSGDWLSTNLGDDFRWVFMNSGGLESLTLSKFNTDEREVALQSLVFSTHLRKLDLSIAQNDVVEAGPTLIRYLRGNFNLRTLTLRITAEEGRKLFDTYDGPLSFLDDIAILLGMEACRVECLVLHGVRLKRGSLAHLLSSTAQVNLFRSLRFQDCELSIDAFKDMCNWLPSMRHLRNLSFTFPTLAVLASHNMVGGEDLTLTDLQTLFISSLSANRSLTGVSVEAPKPLLVTISTFANRNRLQVVDQDKGFQLSLWPRVLESLCRNGADYTAVFQSLKRHLYILPEGGTRKRRFPSVDEESFLLDLR